MWRGGRTAFCRTTSGSIAVLFQLEENALSETILSHHSHYFLYDWSIHMWFVQKVSGLTTVHEVDKAYGVLTLIVFNSYTLCPTFLPLLETFCKLLFRDV
jgi:hypothetical protein